MITLKPAEQELRHALIASAIAPRDEGVPLHTIEYWLAFAEGGRVELGRMAHHVNQYETEHGRPELSYFGPRDDPEAKIVFAHARDFWRGLDVKLMDALDAQFAAIASDLVKIKQMLRTLLHGGDE